MAGVVTAGSFGVDAIGSDGVVTGGVFVLVTGVGAVVVGAVVVGAVVVGTVVVGTVVVGAVVVGTVVVGAGSILKIGVSGVVGRVVGVVLGVWVTEGTCGLLEGILADVLEKLPVVEVVLGGVTAWIGGCTRGEDARIDGVIEKAGRAIGVVAIGRGVEAIA